MSTPTTSTAEQDEAEPAQNALASRIHAALGRAKTVHSRNPKAWNANRLAREAGLDRSCLSRILSGQRVNLRPDTLSKLAVGVAKAEGREVEPVLLELRYAVMNSR